MKRHLLIFGLLLATCLPLTAQVNPVQPLARKLILVEFTQDFQAFTNKVTNLKVTKKNKAALAAEYSDLIDRMDEIFHSPVAAKKNNNQIVTSNKTAQTRINH